MDSAFTYTTMTGVDIEKGPNGIFKNITEEEARQCKLAYYATVSFIDAQVGRLLDTLEKHDLMKNTLIVFNCYIPFGLNRAVV